MTDHAKPPDDLPLFAWRPEPIAPSPTPDRYKRAKGDPRDYSRTSRAFWCVMILRFTRWSALSIVFVSQPSRSAMSS